MYYSIEDIYKYSGQFDKTVTVSFYSNSDAFKEYGSFLTGTFYYTPKERQSVYFNGDYYAVQIANDGKLTRFHKNN
jgi:hypothetical protein